MKNEIKNQTATSCLEEDGFRLSLFQINLITENDKDRNLLDTSLKGNNPPLTYQKQDTIKSDNFQPL